MSTSEKNVFNIILLIVLFGALIYLYLTQPFDDLSLSSVIAMGTFTLQAIFKYVHDYRNRNQTHMERTWFQLSIVVSSLFIILYLFWVDEWVVLKLFFWVLEGFLFYGYVKKLILNKLDAEPK